MKNKLAVTVGASACGLFAGLLLASGGVKGGLVKALSLAGLGAIPPVFLTHLILDTRFSRKLNDAEGKAFEYSAKLDKSESKVAELEAKNKNLVCELTTIRQTLEKTILDRDVCRGMIETLKPSIEQLERDLAASKNAAEELQAECDEWESEFHSRVATEANRQFQEAKVREMQRLCQENDAITTEAMGLLRRLQTWGVKVAQGHSQKREIITSLASAYNTNIDEANALFNKEREQYLTQIELLNERIGLLQHELNGDLVEPVYLECGFDESGRIANAIARLLWSDQKIPLKVTGFESNSDGSITVGFTYSRSMAPEALSQLIERDSSSIARTLGLYAVEKAYKLSITDCLAIKVRRERPARKTDKGSLYRSKEEFVRYILSQPVRLRIIGDPGAGKTPSVAVLLSHILSRGFLSANTPNGQKLPYCVVESCNPLAGISVKNGNDLDFCLKWNDGKKGFKGLAQEYRFRKSPENAEYKNQVGYIWIADEVDNSLAEMTKDEAKPFKDALKDGGHVNIGVIVMGQSANVSTSKGLSIDDQKMMTNIYIDPVSIRTFLTQYGERFYSKKAVEKALNTLEELELEIEEQNEIICDTAREFRIAMVTANRSPVFYQLPYFDSVEIDVKAYQETLDKVSGIREGRGETRSDTGVSADSQTIDAVTFLQQLQKSGRSPYAGSGTRPDTSLKPSCPHCNSELIRSKGDKWMCQNPEHSTVAPNKPKSWKK